MIKELVLVAVVAAPALVFAQPVGSSPEGGETATQPGPTPPQASTPDADDAHVRELVDRELARILTERGAKEAAAQAAKEAAAKDAVVSKGGEDNLTGDSGFMDTRLAFTLTDENLLAKPGETIPSAPGIR